MHAHLRSHNWKRWLLSWISSQCQRVEQRINDFQSRYDSSISREKSYAMKTQKPGLKQRKRQWVTAAYLAVYDNTIYLSKEKWLLIKNRILVLPDGVSVSWDTFDPKLFWNILGRPVIRVGGIESAVREMHPPQRSKAGANLQIGMAVDLRIPWIGIQCIDSMMNFSVLQGIAGGGRSQDGSNWDADARIRLSHSCLPARHVVKGIHSGWIA